VEHSPFLKKIATNQWVSESVSEWVSESVSEWVSEKAKLIRGDPPKIALKRRGSPLKSSQIFWISIKNWFCWPKKKFKNSFNSDFFPVFTRCIPPINLPSGLKINCEKKNYAFL
jgi:hypothetical protein